MKLLKSISLASLVLLFVVLGCQKDNPGIPGNPNGYCDTLTIHDTTIVHDTVEFSLTRTQMLTQHPWEVDQLAHVIGGVYSSYIDGGTNTTGIPYEKLRFTFNADGTGSHVDQFGVTSQLTWRFPTPDERSIELTVHDSHPLTYTWQMVEITNNFVHATVNLTVNGSSDNMESFRLKSID